MLSDGLDKANLCVFLKIVVCRLHIRREMKESAEGGIDMARQLVGDTPRGERVEQRNLFTGWTDVDLFPETWKGRGMVGGTF